MTRILLALILLRLSITHDYWFWIFGAAWGTWELLRLDDLMYEKRRKRNV
ncbi:hypothetical protein [Enterococcus italicus]|nr:hypothetical protein [Enterococcus italicus]